MNDWLGLLEFVCVCGSSVWGARRLDKKHSAALKRMQTALWNDRQLRLGRTPSTTSGKTIPLPETGESNV